MSKASALRPKPSSSAWIRAPRDEACSYVSSTNAPAPSPSTNPSRLAVNGRLAPSGSSFRVLSAFITEKPPKAIGVTIDSAPPAITTSASPAWSMRIALPIASAPLVQAVTVVLLGPWNPCRMAICAEPMLAIIIGMKNGLMAHGAARLGDASLVLEGGHAADAGADERADAGAVDGLEVEPAVLEREVARDDRELSVAVHPLRFLAIDPRRHVDVGVPGELRREVRDVEAVDRAHAAAAGELALVEGVGADADGRDRAEAGDDDAAHRVWELDAVERLVAVPDGFEITFIVSTVASGTPSSRAGPVRGHAVWTASGLRANRSKGAISSKPSLATIGADVRRLAWMMIASAPSRTASR